MSWRAWILLSLAWETSLSLVSAMAVKKGHRVSILDVDGVSAQQPNCGTCDLADRDDTSLYDQCNFWGDPHVTRRFGPLGARDYQGGGVQNVTRTTDDCNQLEMQAFHCQYKNSQNNVMLGALVQITVDGTVVKVYIKPTPSGLSVDVSPPSVVTVIVRSDNKAVTISSPDGCLYIFIDLKTISVAPLYILNMKSRVLKDLPIIGPDGGYCGAQPADTATVTDNSTWLFTESQVLELCDLCSAGGAQIIPPGCPGATPPAGDPVGLPRCSFADAIVARDDNIVEFECTGTIQDRINLIDQGDTLVLTDNDCAFGYTANSVNADRLSCSAICNLIAPGSTCKGTLNGDEKCLGTNFDEGECDAANNDGACLCGNIPDSLAQQEGPTVDQLLDLNGVDDDDLDRAAELERVIKICTSDGTNFLTGARAGFNKLWFQNQRSVLSLYFFRNGKKCWTEEGWRGVLQKKIEEVLQKCFEGCVWKKCCRKFCRGEVFTGNWSMVAWGVVWEWFGEEVLRK